MKLKKVVEIPIVAGALGLIRITFEKYIESLGIDIRVEDIQKSAFLGAARIIRKVLSCKISRDTKISSL